MDADLCEYDKGSFKDPSGRVFYHKNQIYREVDEESINRLKKFFSSKAFEVTKDRFVETSIVSHPNHLEKQVLKHKKITFQTYPYEWTPRQLQESGLFVLGLTMSLIEHGYTFKDATSFNVMFSEGKPYWIDITSIEEHEKGQAWVGFMEALECYLYPLLIYKTTGFYPQPMLVAQLGKISLEQITNILNYKGIFSTTKLSYVTLLSFLNKKVISDYKIENSEINLKISKKSQLNTIRNLKSDLNSLNIQTKKSHWVDYNSTNTYSGDATDEKQEFVIDCLKSQGNYEGLAIDLGANTGMYTEILNDFYHNVLAVESDIQSCEYLYELSKVKPGIKIIQMDLVRPSPGLGWNGEERKSFLNRFKNSEMVLVLGLIHHLRITNNVPFEFILRLISSLGKRVVLEWVPIEDPMVKHLLKRRKSEDYTDYCLSEFKTQINVNFEIISELEICTKRILFYLKRKF
jgi:hypothetical protein